VNPPAGHLLEIGRKSVGYPVNDKIEQSLASHFLRFGINEASIAQAAHRGVDFRGTHSQGLPQIGIALPGSSEAELKGDYDILWLGNNRNT